MAPGKEIIRQAEEVVGLVEQLCRLIKLKRTELAGELGLSRAELDLLWVAGEQAEGISVREAAEVLGVRPQGLSTLAVQLERKGLLVRGRDPQDGRTRRLLPSDKGRSLLSRAREVREAWAQAVLSAVPQPAVARLVLQRLISAL